MNGLRYDIQDELSMVTIRVVEDAYQMALKEEEKLSRKQGQRGWGRSQPLGKAVAQEKYQKPKEEWKKPQGKIERGGTSQRGQQYVEQRKTILGSLLSSLFFNLFLYIINIVITILSMGERLVSKRRMR